LFESTGYSKDSRLKCIEKALNIKQLNGLGEDLQSAQFYRKLGAMLDSYSDYERSA